MSRCSVIIPAYNVEDYVGESIESALSQTYRDVEVIVVNDGSTDGTARAIDPYRDRIIYIEQENRGLAGARNRALEVATGQFIALLDADDSWLPTRLEKMIGKLETSTEISFATSDCYLIADDGTRLGTFYSSRPRRERFRFENQPYWIVQYNFVFIMTVTRRELFERHGTFDESLRAAEDWDLWLRFITSGERVDLLNEPLGNYRVRSEGLSYDPRHVWPYELAILERAAQMENTRNFDGVNGRLAFAQGKNALLKQDFKGASSYFWKAVRDRKLPTHRRLEALAAGAAPKKAWRSYSKGLPTSH